MGSALHIGMCRCHGAPGTVSGRVSGHGCQEGDRVIGQMGLSPPSQVPAIRQEVCDEAPAKDSEG